MHNHCLTSESLIGPVVGGVLAAVVVVLVIVLVILLFVCLVKRKRSSKYDMSKATDLEMRDSRPKKPILGGEKIFGYKKNLI